MIGFSEFFNSWLNGVFLDGGLVGEGKEVLDFL